MQRHALHRGFTLLEVAVAIAVIGLLAALIVPAVQQARSASLRVACSNNLRQIGLALIAYHDVHNVLPERLGSSGGCGNYHAIVRVFPLLELPEYCTLRKTEAQRLPVLICPADDTSAVESPLSYPLSAGLGTNFGTESRGPFPLFQEDAVSLREVVDGTSHTAAVSERATYWAGGTARSADPPERYTWDVRVPFLSNPPLEARREQTEQSLLDCYHGPRTFRPLTEPHLGSWRGSGAESFYAHGFVPNAPRCIRNPGTFDNPFLSFHENAASSAHEGGVHVAYLDGHVRFVSETIDRDAWRAVGTIDGHEVATVAARSSGQ